MSSLPPNHPFIASLTPSTKVWSSPSPPPLIDWSALPISPAPTPSPSPSPSSMKRPLALLLRHKKADSPTPKTPKTPTHTPRPNSPATPRPSLDSAASPSTSPKTPRRTPRSSHDNPVPGSPVSSAGPLTPPAFLMRRLPSLSNLRRKRIEAHPAPLGFEWVDSAIPVAHGCGLDAGFTPSEDPPLPASLPAMHSQHSHRSEHKHSKNPSPTGPYEPHPTHTSPEPKCALRPSPPPPSDKRTRRHCQIFSAGFADALSAELRAGSGPAPNHRAPRDGRGAAGHAGQLGQRGEAARDPNEQMLAQLRAMGIL